MLTIEPQASMSERFNDLFLETSAEDEIGFPSSRGFKFTRSQLSAEVRATFAELSEWWHRDTDSSSSIHRKITHPAYLQIIGMGKSVVPCIFAELRNRQGHWFIALESITKVNPVPEAHFGQMDLITQDWLEYARQSNLAGPFASLEG